MQEKCETKENNGLSPKNGAFHWHTAITQCVIGKSKSLIWISGVGGQLICVWNKSILAWSCGRSLKIVSVFRLVQLDPLENMASYLVSWVREVGAGIQNPISYDPHCFWQPACLVWLGLVLNRSQAHPNGISSSKWIFERQNTIGCYISFVFLVFVQTIVSCHFKFIACLARLI